jgi:hypothetical protein
MTSNRNLGHGICGFKNEYSTNVKMGNWVEDKIGLSITTKSNSFLQHTTTIIHHHN